MRAHGGEDTNDPTMIDQVNDRGGTDTAIAWDSTGILMELHHQPETGDTILNPPDARYFSWNPKWELSGVSAFEEAMAAIL